MKKKLKKTRLTKPLTPNESYIEGSDPINQNKDMRSAVRHKDLMEKLEKQRQLYMKESSYRWNLQNEEEQPKPEKPMGKSFIDLSNDSDTTNSISFRDRFKPQPSTYATSDYDSIFKEEDYITETHSIDFEEIYKKVAENLEEKESENNTQNMATQNSLKIIKLLTNPKYLNNNIFTILKSKGYINILTIKFLIAISKKRTNEASIYLINILMHKLTSQSLSQLFHQIESRYSARLEIIKNNSKTENSYNYNIQTLDLLKEILYDFRYVGFVEFIKDEFINKIPLEIDSSKNISQLEEDYQIDITSLFSINDYILDCLAAKGLFLYIKGKFSDLDSNKEFTIKSQSVLKTIYYKSIHMGFTIDPIINFFLVLNPIDFDRLQIHISLHANHSLRQLLILYVKVGNRSLILKSGNIKKTTNYDNEQVLEYLSYVSKSKEGLSKEYIILGEHKISKSLFEEATECNIEELIANLQFEESL